jgi:ferredoxin
VKSIMKRHIKLHLLHVNGKYYVDEDTCLACDTCNYYAPGNFKYDFETSSSYIFKQPETPDEEENCKKALRACAVEAIYDDGNR